MTEHNQSKSVGFAGAAITLLFLILAICIQVFVLDNSDSTHITLIMVTAVASVTAMRYGFSWQEIQDAILYGCNLAMMPMLILMLVGALIASWIAAGTIPALIYYGILLITPEFFLFSVCLACSFGSLATGSSWTTAATFGVGFMGVGIGLGIAPEITAGAVISGAIFGDKMSPLSDSTNLASAVAEADLFDHIRSMLYSTGPAILITLAIYFVWGSLSDGGSQVNDAEVKNILAGIERAYSLNVLVFLPPLLVLTLAVQRVSAIAVIVIASLVGLALAVLLQDHTMAQMLTFMNFGYEAHIGIERLDALLSRGGLQNMMWTVSLGFVALSMGGVLERTGMLAVLLEKMQFAVKSVGGLVTTHVFSAFAINLLSASQFMALIIPGRMLVPMYREKKLLPQVCSRVCEDSATVTSPLVPWGLGGVYYTGVLGVETLDYLPYTFLALIVPPITLIYAFSNRFMFREGDIKTAKSY